jgi:hypothetical protein
LGFIVRLLKNFGKIYRISRQSCPQYAAETPVAEPPPPPLSRRMSRRLAAAAAVRKEAGESVLGSDSWALHAQKRKYRRVASTTTCFAPLASSLSLTPDPLKWLPNGRQVHRSPSPAHLFPNSCHYGKQSLRRE